MPKQWCTTHHTQKSAQSQLNVQTCKLSVQIVKQKNNSSAATLNTKEITRASKAICSEAMNSEHVQSHYLWHSNHVRNMMSFHNQWREQVLKKLIYV